MSRHLIHKGLGYLNVVAEHPVVIYFQGADTGFLFFSSLDGSHSAGAAVHNIPQPIHFFVGALADDTAVTDSGRGIVINGLFNQMGAVAQIIDNMLQLLQQGRLAFLQLLLYLRQRPQTTGKAQKIPTVYSAGNDPGSNTLQIGNILKKFSQLTTANRGIDQFLHGRLSANDLRGIQQGLFQPAAEHSAAHGRVGLVQYPQK